MPSFRAYEGHLLTFGAHPEPGQAPSSQVPPTSTLAETLDRLLGLGVKFFVAWHPDCPAAFLRWKDATGLAEWRSRAWEAFSSPPVIVDVTEQVPAWLAAPAGLFCPSHEALGSGHAACPGVKRVDSDWTFGSFCWVAPQGGLRCRAFAATAEEEAAHTAATGHDDWLAILPHSEPFPNPGPRERTICRRRHANEVSAPPTTKSVFSLQSRPTLNSSPWQRSIVEVTSLLSQRAAERKERLPREFF